jgi:hypothetical protein
LNQLQIIHFNSIRTLKKTIQSVLKMIFKKTQDYFFRADCEKPVLRSRSERGRGVAKASL